MSDVEFSKKNNDHTYKKVINEHCVIEGEWTNHIKFDNTVYWNIKDYKYFELYEQEHKLKSDSSYRDDLKCINENLMDLCQVKKEELEEIQRNDHKLRDEYKKLLDKVNFKK